MNECKIVQDLMPLYIDDLLSQESAETVRSHAEGCEECRKMLERCRKTMPGAEQINPQKYKASLRRDTMKMMGQFMLLGLILTLLFLAVFAFAVGIDFSMFDSQTFGSLYPLTFDTLYIENTYESKAVDYPVFYAIAVTDIENGLKLLTRDKISETDESEAGASGWNSSDTIYPWESMELYWSPDGMDALIVAQIIDGGTGYYVWDHEIAVDEEGNLSSTENWYPSPHFKGMTEDILPLCQAHPDFPTGWETVEFTFFRWSDDSERITFVYELDNGTQGFLEYEYKTETITAVD